MKKKMQAITAGILSAALALGAFPVHTFAATPLAGVAVYTSTALTSASIPTAGVSLAITQCMQDGENELVMTGSFPIQRHILCPIHCTGGLLGLFQSGGCAGQ